MPWCFAVPLKPGRAEEAVRILDKVKAMPEAAKLMRDHDIIRSISYLQRAPQGDFIIRHILASAPLDDLIAGFVSCDHDTCRKARDVAKEITGLDYSDPRQQPRVELLFKWDESRGIETADQVIAYTE